MLLFTSLINILNLNGSALLMSMIWRKDNIDIVNADIDECELSPCSSGEECVNTEGSYICRLPESCQPGYRREHESQECQGQSQE